MRTRVPWWSKIGDGLAAGDHGDGGACVVASQADPVAAD